MVQKRKKLTEDDIKRIVNHELALSESARALQQRENSRALDYFQGKMSDMPSEVGRSSAVSLDVADTMGWVLPGIIRVFTASQHMAIVEPAGSEDVEWAENATDGVNHVFLKENDGYRIIHSATWDALIAGNGVIKTWYDDTPQTCVSFHSGLNDLELAELVSPDEVTVLEHEERMEEVQDPASGATAEYRVHDVKIERIKAYGCIKIEAIAPEDYGKDDESRTCDEARFQFHKARKTRSDLLEMGFDRDLVEKVGRAELDTQEELARNQYSHEQDADESMEVVDFYEIFMRVDVNGDGIAEMVKVDYAGHASGGQILHWSEWEDDAPFDDIPCDPMPHRWNARSLANETMDVQQIKTALTRGVLDNIYANANPQRFVTGTIKNPDSLFSPAFGEVIFGESGAMITAMPVPFVADKVLDGISYMDNVIERRTGVSRTTMALDPEALQNQTATANQNARDAAYSQIELIARNMAELGWKKVFKKILQLEIKHRNMPRQIRMKGKPVTVDPRHWNADMDVSINVGLGTGSRDRDMAILNQVKMDLQTLAAAAMQSGYTKVAVEVLPYLLTTMHKFGESSGLHNPELFYPEITDEDVLALQQQIEQQSQQPDPKTTLEQGKMQMQAQLDQFRMQMEQQKMQFDMAIQQQQAQAAIQKEAAQFEADARIKEMDIAFKQQELMFKQQAEQAKLMLTREIEYMKLGKQADGITPMPGTETQVTKATMDQLVSAISQLTTAPKRIVRDPDTGKALGLETMQLQIAAPGAEAPNPADPADNKDLEKLLMMVAQIASAPKRIVRDPETGKAIGVEPVGTPKKKVN